MPDITLPPVLIDPSANQANEASPTNAVIGPKFAGPFVVGGAIYLVLSSLPGEANTLQVWKSTDHGVTWAQMDAAHSPAFTNVNGFCGYTAKLSPDSQYILIAYNATVNVGGAGDGKFPTSWAKFWTAAGPLTDQFAVSGVPLLTISNRIGNDCDFSFRPDGSVMLVYTIVTGGPNAVYNIWPGSGAWGGPVTIQAGMVGNEAHANVVCADSVGRANVFGSFGGNPYYWQISPGGAIVNAQAYTPAIGPSWGTGFGPAQAIMWGDNVVLASTVPKVITGVNNVLSVVDIGVGVSSGAPVFTRTILDTFPPQAWLTFCSCQAWVGSRAELIVAWIYAPDSDHTILNIRRAVNSGSGFAATGVFYDYPTNPLNSLTAAQQIFAGLSVATIGSAGAVLTGIDATNMSNVGYFLAQAVSTVPTSQLVFMGVRRMKGPKPTLAPGCPYKPKSFTYTLNATLTVAYPVTAPVKVVQTVNDYDFDLYNLIFTYIAGGAALSRVVMQVMLFDAVHQQTSNLPVNDVYWNDSRVSTNPYRVGAVVTPLLYPQQSQIRLDLYSMLKTAQLPVTVQIQLVGRQRIPA